MQQAQVVAKSMHAGRALALNLLDNPDHLMRVYRATRYVNDLGVASCALIVADFLQTFPSEVRLMWPTPRSVPKYLFFAVRYYALLNAIFALMYALPTGLTPEQCKTSFLRVSISSLLVVVASEAILLLRAHAFSGRSTRTLILLIAQFAIIHASAFVLFAKFIQSVQFEDLSIPNITCVPTQAESKFLGGMFVLTLCSISIVMFIMAYITMREYRQNFHCSLLTAFYQDGLFYFISLSALAVANIIVNFVARGGYGFLLVQPETTIHAILSTRMLLHLRSIAEKEQEKRTQYEVDMLAPQEDTRDIVAESSIPQQV